MWMDCACLLIRTPPSLGGSCNQRLLQDAAYSERSTDEVSCSDSSDTHSPLLGHDCLPSLVHIPFSNARGPCGPLKSRSHVAAYFTSHSLRRDVSEHILSSGTLVTRQPRKPLGAPPTLPGCPEPSPQRLPARLPRHTHSAPSQFCPGP